ncbi:hypothetical protein [Dyadobacter sandarakinus]|uniref:Outer membrane protein beta-barrel domain-containing protein n=1 Tax=Dyadobacter sandarakinus TaxID=2747268 RepID=A0ABX7IAD2_9BACT|nr:hypothetical protein [Dyadobacter sandarakinus]QRR03077.1 hypothetical protein HWI92_20260 [Dyadobacter sandarakinus]
MIFRYLQLCVLIILAAPALAQIQFEKGYFIDDQNQKTECLLRNVGWENNPQSFRYKLSPTGETLTGSIDHVKEFGTENGITYIRDQARIDESPTDVGALSHDRNPMWAVRMVFLNRLVHGPAKLFLYRSGNLRQFYYQKGDSLIVPLVYKQYINDDGQAMFNYGFRQQLLNDVNCGDISQNSLSRLTYREGDLVSFFQKYNACTAPGAKPLLQPEKRDALHVKVTPGLNLNMLSTDQFTFSNEGSRHATSPAFRIGLEGEYVLSVNRNKWSILVEPVWQHYHYKLNVVNTNLNVQFWSVDVVAGARHYFFLKNNSKLFVNALGVLRTITGTSKNAAQQMEVYTNWFYYAAGAGLASNRFSAEVRYNSPVPFRSSYMRIDAEHARLALVLGYRLF